MYLYIFMMQMNLTMLHPRFYRNDSVSLDDLLIENENCDGFTVFMAGEMTFVYSDDHIPNRGKYTQYCIS